MKKQEKTAKITESGHSSVAEPGGTVTGASRDDTCRVVTSRARDLQSDAIIKYGVMII